MGQLKQSWPGSLQQQRPTKEVSGPLPKLPPQLETPAQLRRNQKSGNRAEINDTGNQRTREKSAKQGAGSRPHQRHWHTSKNKRRHRSTPPARARHQRRPRRLPADSEETWRTSPTCAHATTRVPLPEPRELPFLTRQETGRQTDLRRLGKRNS